MGSAPISGPLRKAFAELRQGLERVAKSPDAPEKHAGQLEPALAELREVFDVEGTFTLEVSATALLNGGVAVHTEHAREAGICLRLHRDGVRTLTFRRGLYADELLTFCRVAFQDPQRGVGPGREDAVTELWKADLVHISFTALDGYRMEGGEFDVGRVAEVVAALRAGARPSLLAAAAPRASSDPLPPPLIPAARLRELDPQQWPQLAQRAAIAVLRIIEQGLSGRDRDAVEQSFLLLLGELDARGELELAGRALQMVQKMSGQNGSRFRGAVGKWLADPARLARAVKQAAASERALAQTLPAWLSLLPRDLGGALLTMFPAAPAAVQPLLARAAVERVGPGAEQLARALAEGPPGEALALLAAFDGLAPATRAGFGALALKHRSPRVRIEAAAAVACKPELGAPLLGKLLQSPEKSVRIAAAHALSSCTAVAEVAGQLLVAAMGAARFGRRAHDEQLAFHCALGRLGSTIGFEFLVARLGERRGIFRRPSAKLRLMAIAGLEEESSARAIRALGIATAPESRQPAAVADAAHAAGMRLRLQQRRAGSRG